MLKKAITVLVVILPLGLIVACGPESPPQTVVVTVVVTESKNFSYLVSVQAKETGENIRQAKVIIQVPGKPPLDEITDSTGLARTSIEASYVGQPGKLIVEAMGYERYVQNIDLTEGNLPDVIQLESLSTPTNIPAPSPNPTDAPIATSTSTPTAIPTPLPILSFQDFEEDNGTPANYCKDGFAMPCELNGSIVYEGKRAIRGQAQAHDGGTVWVYPISNTPFINLSSASRLFVWVYDVQGGNDVQLVIKDRDDNRSNEVWSDMTTTKEQWTEITWELKRFNGIDLSRVDHIEFYMRNDGEYYFDAVRYK